VLVTEFNSFFKIVLFSGEVHEQGRDFSLEQGRDA